jgi:TonB family protein
VPGILTSLLNPSPSLMGWGTSAVVHVVALGGLATFGAANLVWVGEASVPRGQAITLQAKFAAPAGESSDEATIRRDRDVEPARPKWDGEIAPQATSIERHEQVVELPRVTVESPAGIELLTSIEAPMELSDRRRKTETLDPEAIEVAPPPHPARQPAALTIDGTGLDKVSQTSSMAGANVPAQPHSSNRSPDYPADALQERRQGTAVVRILISREGNVVQAEIYTSSGTPSLDESALTAVRRWRFAPARRDGIAIEQKALAPVPFRIEVDR